MGNRLLAVLVPLAGLAMVTLPGAGTPAAAPSDTACAGGICDVCPVVAAVLSAAGAEVACLA